MHLFPFIFPTITYPLLQRHMERLPETRELTESFPWGRIESDGTTNAEIIRARFDVLGGSYFGYWSHRGGPQPHTDQGLFSQMVNNSPYAAVVRKMMEAFDHLDGKDLLKQWHLTDEQGWILHPRFIPYREFTAQRAKKPVLVTEFPEPITDWDRWYRWRGLAKKSPVVLLMSFPMSVYQLLVHCLEVTGPKKGSPDERVALEVHMIGLEVELNYLPA